jgi:hypothetical protein
MGVNPATFSSAGKISQHYIPGAYSRDNFISNEGGGVSSGNSCILGYAELGEPQKLLVFGSANDARAELVSGAGLEGVIEAFNPGGGFKPQQVGFMRVNDGLQADRTLLKTATSIFNIKSFSWGVPMNQLRLQFLAGTVVGSHQIKTEWKGTVNDVDDVERKSFSLQYTGAGSAATIALDATTLATTVTGGPGGEDLSLILEDYPTINEIVAVINNNDAYSATVLTDTPTQKSVELDFVTGDILTSPVTLKSDYQAVFEALQANTLLGTITKSGTERNVPDYDTGYIYFSGGTSGAYTVSEFSSGLAVIETADVQLVGTVSTEAAVHALIKIHCDDMNAVEGRKERQFYVGGALSEDVTAVNTRSFNLNSSFGSLCSPGYYNYDDSGAVVLRNSAFFACQQIGMVSAIGINNPTTSKTMNNLGWEKDYKRTEKNTLIKGGVLVGAKDESGRYITVRSITSYQGASLQQNEASIMRETLYQAADLRKRLSTLVGTPNLGNDQIATAKSIFERAILDWKGLGIIVPSEGKLYSGLVVVINGDIISLEYNTWNTAPTNFVFITHNVSVLVQ